MRPEDDDKLKRWPPLGGGLLVDPQVPATTTGDAARSSEALIAEQPDNWRNRSQGMRCATCIHFVPKASPRLAPGPQLGRCRRHAPTLSGWPAVFATDWCGDHKLDENKL